jgi:hypothetical protein
LRGRLWWLQRTQSYLVTHIFIKDRKRKLLKNLYIFKRCDQVECPNFYDRTSIFPYLILLCVEHGQNILNTILYTKKNKIVRVAMMRHPTVELEVRPQVQMEFKIHFEAFGFSVVQKTCSFTLWCILTVRSPSNNLY